MKKYRGLGKKIIVFAHHLDVMDAIEDSLRALQVSYIRVDGSVNKTVRNDKIKKFQDDDDVK